MAVTYAVTAIRAPAIPGHAKGRLRHSAGAAGLNTRAAPGGVAVRAKNGSPSGSRHHHAVARTWLEATLAGVDTGTAFTLMPMVLASFLRLVSSSKIFKVPTPV